MQAVGDADDETTRNLLVARAGPGGGDFQVHAMVPPGPVPPVPGNEVPDPSTDAGRQLQEMVREQDLSTSVRETTETTDERTGNHIKTVFMMDGSKQVITTEGGWPPSEHVLPEGSIQVEQYDKAGNYVSDSLTTESEDGTQTTNIWWTDGTSVVMTRTPDGKCTGGGSPHRTARVASGTESCRTSSSPTRFRPWPGGALTGLEKQAERGIPGLSAEALENIGAGAKFGGPALGVATALYNVATAETAHDVCVNAWSGGGVGVVGGIGFDAALTVMAPGIGSRVGSSSKHHRWFWLRVPRGNRRKPSVSPVKNFLVVAFFSSSCWTGLRLRPFGGPSSRSPTVNISPLSW